MSISQEIRDYVFLKVYVKFEHSYFVYIYN